MNKFMQAVVSHSFGKETQEAKAIWFQSLSVQERIRMLCEFTEMILSVKPNVVERKKC